MSVSGPSGFQPILNDLHSIASNADTSLPEWLAGWLDGSANVKSAIETVLADGTVTGDEVKSIVTEAYDYGDMRSGEKEALTLALNENPSSFEPAAREALAQFLGVPNPLPTAPTTPVDPTTPTDPTAPTAPTGPVPTDYVSAEILEKHGLATDSMNTVSNYDGHDWDVGYFPYTGAGQYQAFGKFDRVFGHGGEDGNAYFEMYSNPPSGLNRGSWIASGRISESDFEGDAGVDVSGDRPINDALYAAIRKSGASKYANFAVLDSEGKGLDFGPGDTLVPSREVNGQLVESDSAGDTWRIKRADGTIDGSGEVTSRKEAIGAKDSVAFDFLDATGGMVGFNPGAGDTIPETFKDDDGKWHALHKQDDGSFKHQVIDGDSITSTETIDQAARDALVDGKDTMYRVQTSSGSLKGDGSVGETYNMGWWGKCHNVASLSTSNIDRPDKPVKVVSNLEAGDTLALQYGDNVLRPNDDGTFTHEVRSGGSVQSSSQISAEQANQLAADNSAGAVIFQADGSLKEAEVTTFNTDDIDALTSHIGDGAVESKGGEGQRYYAHPDILVMKDGRQIQAHIKEVDVEGGGTETIGSRSGYDFKESSREALRAPGMESRVLRSGSRSMAFNVQDMSKLNEFRNQDIEKLTIIHPDGREEEIDASDVELVAWENKYDFRPDQLWTLHETVTEQNSTVSETSTDTQVWNYATRGVDTEVLDPASLSASQIEDAKKPGMMTGTIEEEGKVFFRSKIETDGGQKDLTYWVRFDDEGEVTDYGYLDKDVPDFVWTQHVKDPFETTWTGASQAPGISNAEVQRIYLASQGALDGSALGGFLSQDALMNGAVVRPDDNG